MEEILALLRSHRLRYDTERQMQDDIERLLATADLNYVREYETGDGPIDFYLPDHGIGIECKVQGGPSEILSQLIRYAATDTIRSLILVTSRRTHRFDSPTLQGKPFATVWVAANAL